MLQHACCVDQTWRKCMLHVCRRHLDALLLRSVVGAGRTMAAHFSGSLPRQRIAKLCIAELSLTVKPLALCALRKLFVTSKSNSSVT